MNSIVKLFDVQEQYVYFCVRDYQNNSCGHLHIQQIC